MLNVLDRHQMVCKPTKASLFVKAVTGQCSGPVACVAGQRGKNKFERRKRRTKRKHTHTEIVFTDFKSPPMNFCAAVWRGQQRNPYNPTTMRTEGRNRQDSATRTCPKTPSKVRVVGLVQWSVDTKSNDEEDKRYVPTRRGMEPPKEGRAPNNYQTKAEKDKVKTS